MKPHCLTARAVALLMVCCMAGNAGAVLYRSFTHDPPAPMPPREFYGGVVVLKFHNDIPISRTLAAGRFFQSPVAAQDQQLAVLRSLLAAAGAASPRPTFSRAPAMLRGENDAAKRSVGADLPDLTLFFDVPVPDYHAAAALLNALRTNSLVETAYARSRPLPPPTPDLSTNQIYLGPAATNGYDVNYAWSKPGGNGSQARLIDIEYDWTFGHEDLQMRATNLLWGDLYTNYGPDHGTASVGISGALSNGFGMNGIIHQGAVSMISSVSSGFWVIADAINQAVARTAPGDVILLEQQETSSTFGNYCPVEVRADIYSAIANATALDRIVIEPAGNGNLDLDNAGWSNIFQRATRDSGAIMVGAGESTSRARCIFSCYGSRLDIQGWGDWSVATLAYGDLAGSSATDNYTRTFSGTSSGSALSAAIAGAIQSYARANYGFYLPPLMLRSNLVQSGYAQTFGLSGNIGPLPNLSNALAGVDILALVTPWDGLAAQGVYGGPFSPTQKIYRLTNASPGTVAWTVSNVPPWLTVSTNWVALPAWSGTQVVAAIGAAAAAMPAGPYTQVVVFSNVTSGTVHLRTMALTIARASQTIQFPNPGAQLITNQLNLSASASSGNPVAFSLGGGGPAFFISPTTLVFSGTGQVTVIASQPGDANWLPALNVANVFNVFKLSQPPLTFNPGSPQTYNTTNVLAAAGGAGGGAIAFAVQSGPGQIVGGSNLWITSGVGTVVVAAAKASDPLYAAAVATGYVVAAKAVQTICFPAVPVQTITSRVDLSGTASSGLPVFFTVVSGPGKISAANVLSFRGTGVVVVAASQPGDNNWLAAPQVSISVTVTGSQPDTPTGVSASDGVYPDRVRMSWDYAAGAVSYEVWRHTTRDVSVAAKIGQAVLEWYDDLTALSQTTYYYWIKAVNAAGASSFSAPDSGYTGVVGPLVSVNGMVGDNVRIAAGTPVTIAVEMMNLPAEYVGHNVDWWVAAYAHDGNLWYYLNTDMAFIPFDGNLANCRPAYQGPLMNLPQIILAQDMSLAPGTYNLWFAVDYPRDGILRLDGPILVSRVTMAVE